MAIQKQKIPSPQEVKSSPQSFSIEELNELKNLRSELNNLTARIGQLYVNKIIKLGWMFKRQNISLV